MPAAPNGARAVLRSVLDAELAIIDKRRSEDGTAEVMNVIGDVQRPGLRDCGRHHRHGGDDSEGRAGAAWTTARRACWRARCTACCPGPAMSRIDNAPSTSLIVTNTIPLNGPASSDKVVVLSVARLLAQAIRSIHEETSVSKLFV
jgi:ribose-phosphate pyrophosphokinase